VKNLAVISKVTVLSIPRYSTLTYMLEYWPISIALEANIGWLNGSASRIYLIARGRVSISANIVFEFISLIALNKKNTRE